MDSTSGDNLADHKAWRVLVLAGPLVRLRISLQHFFFRYFLISPYMLEDDPWIDNCEAKSTCDVKVTLKLRVSTRHPGRAGPNKSNFEFEI